ncbi:MAG: DUF4124 domain-containing protein [Kangiellaceae bacterium]|nr:DUF4124 domain-containing protein [Kangiellaceae bacterium]MCW8998529.1 DUF4124 domain-containing protein [Kangiellaceae bacterium]MCW9017905.1 DUF4124 domain-containing protein [Kangiellaceae bacterium]
MKTDYLHKAYNKLTAVLGLNSKASQVTYYQWTDSQGRPVISQTPPKGNQDYIAFEASSDLMKNENIVDEELLQQSAQATASVLSGNQATTNKSKGAKDGSSITVGPFAAIGKAKNCTNLASQVAAANRESPSSEKTKSLKNQYNKECR